jgi:hypothetical protein
MTRFCRLSWVLFPLLVHGRVVRKDRQGGAAHPGAQASNEFVSEWDRPDPK